jgi:hypothetical protein
LVVIRSVHFRIYLIVRNFARIIVMTIEAT